MNVYERAHLGQHRDQGVLAQIGGFTGHVGAGQQPDRVALGGKIAVVGDELVGAFFGQSGLDHWMAACFDLETAALVDLGAGPLQGARDIGETGGDVDLR